MKLPLLLGCGLFAAVTSLPVLAATAPKAPPPPNINGWVSSIEFGAVVSTGNTDQRSFKFQGDTVHDGDRFRHTGHIDYFRQSQDSVTSANKFYGFYQGDYKLSELNALFGRVSYTSDKFSGYSYQEDVTFGYSRLLLQRSNMQLTGEVGAGGRHSKLDDNTTKDEAIGRLALAYQWQVSQSALFKQALSAEIGSNTILRSETSLETTIVGNLAMKLAIAVKHQSEVPFGFKKTDTESSATIVYNF